MGIYDFTLSDLSTASLVAIDVPQMTFPLSVIDTIWQFDFQLIIGSSSAAGLKISLTVPPGAAFRVWAVGSGASKNGLIVDSMTQSGVLGVAFNTFIGSQNFLSIRGGVKNGGLAGALQLQVAKVTSGTATMFTGSFFTANQL